MFKKILTTLAAAGALLVGGFALSQDDPPAEATGVTSTVVHSVIVESGDTLSLIGQQWGQDPVALAQVNGISLDTIIYPGQELVLPVAVTIDGPATVAPQYLPACIHEDGSSQGPCYWNAQTQGNGYGQSVINY